MELLFVAQRWSSWDTAVENIWFLGIAKSFVTQVSCVVVLFFLPDFESDVKSQAENLYKAPVTFGVQQEQMKKLQH